MRGAVLFLLGALLGACVRPQTSVVAELPAEVQQSHVRGAAALVDKTVALVQPTPQGMRAFCTGVWVTPTNIVTARHCVGDIELDVEPVFYGVASDMLSDAGELSSLYFVHTSVVLAKDEDHDLAMLRALSAPKHDIAALSPLPIEPGLFVQTMGHPIGLYYSYSSGTIAAVRSGGLMDDRWIQATAPISPGSSGGGLFDAEGRLVGIATGALRAPAQNINLFVHRDHVAALMATATR